MTPLLPISAVVASLKATHFKIPHENVKTNTHTQKKKIFQHKTNETAINFKLLYFSIYSRTERSTGTKRKSINYLIKCIGKAVRKYFRK